MNADGVVPRRAVGTWPLKLVVVQATTFCNLDCDYCYLPDRTQSKRIPFDVLEQAFQRLFSSPRLVHPFTVVWHAGEPLALPNHFYRKAFELIDAAKALHGRQAIAVRHAFQTNATLVTDEWCELFRANGVRVGVSLDGPAFLHDAHRRHRSGRGSHAATLRGLRMLQAAGLSPHVIAVVTADSLDHADSFVEFFLENGIEDVGMNVEEIEGANRMSSLGLAGMEARYRAFLERVYDRAEAAGKCLRIREFKQLESAIRSRVRGIGQCTPYSMISIAYNGDFSTFSPELLSTSSPDYEDFVIGNVRNDSFEDALASPRFLRLNRDVQEGVEACRRQCSYFELCGGGAPANKYSELGTLRGAETLYCRLTRQIPIDIVLRRLETRLGLDQA